MDVPWSTKSTCIEVINVIVAREIPIPSPIRNSYPNWALVCSSLVGRVERRPHPRSMSALAAFNVMNEWFLRLDAPPPRAAPSAAPPTTGNNWIPDLAAETTSTI